MPRSICSLLALGLAACGGPAARRDASDVPSGPDKTAHAFSLWAPNATAVFVQGDFNTWNATDTPMIAMEGGMWQVSVPGAQVGQGYQFVIHHEGGGVTRPDPRGRAMTNSIGHSLIVDPTAYAWQHGGVAMPPWNEQIIYEMHIGSFNDAPGGGPGTFASAMARLDDLAELGVNVIELLPIAEFAGDYSWGYNGAHPFAIESGYGTPDDFRALVDAAHARGIAVVVDVVYNHWGPQDLSLWCFDGPCLGEDNGGIYFYTDWRRESGWGPRPDYGREEVRAYIADNVMMWLEEYNVDGLRFDSTVNIRNASGTDVPEGWWLLQAINDRVDAQYSGRIMIAEDLQGDAWLTKATGEGGAGFDAQWDGGFFHPIHAVLVAPEDGQRSMTVVAEALRGGAAGAPFARVVYTENHDEVANGKQRLPVMIAPNDPAGYHARKRSMLGAALVLTAPAIPMLFQGQEFLEDGYFRDDDPLDWSRAQTFAAVRALYRDLIALRRNLADTTRGLTGDRSDVFHVNDVDKVIAMHRWYDAADAGNVVVAFNFADKAYTGYQLGVPSCGTWQVRFNSDATAYGSDFGNVGATSVAASATPRDGLPCSISLPLGRYAAVILSK
ncbi:MAG: alpha amylase C-terminal domain-containing protein [Myxococcales bacterium]|nr:alpha amylase C-terminal domain-containing protein [Myxococcales bacterium]